MPEQHRLQHPPRRLPATLTGLLLPALLAGLVACGGPVEPAGSRAPPASSAPVGGASGHELAAVQVLRRGNAGEPETLDPHRAMSVTASNVLRDLYEGLVTEAADGSLIPGAAESWTISDDGRVYTFRLRSDGRWSNGDPVTAADFEYGLQRSANPATLSEYSVMLFPIENAQAVVAGELPPDRLGVRALDAATLEIRLHSPTPYFLGLLTHASTYPVHRPSVEAAGTAGFARPGRLVGNGPFVLREWVVQSHIRLVRNREYREDRSTRLDEVWFYPIDNYEAELQRYRTGAIDITYDIPNRQVGWLRKNLADELRIAPYLGSYYFGFNLTRPPFQDNPELRRALSLALDRDILTAKVTGAGEIAAYTWVPPIPGYESPVPEWADWTQEERNAEARRLYAQAGYSPERPLRMQLLYNTDNNHRRLCVAMAAMWREVLGVQTELLNQEWQVFLQTRRERLDTQIFRAGWIGDYLDPYTFAEILHSRSGLNDVGYDNPRYDALLEQASREADPAVRFGLLAEAERLVVHDVPLIPLYFYVSKRLVKPWVGGYQDNIMNRTPSRYLYLLEH